MLRLVTQRDFVKTSKPSAPTTPRNIGGGRSRLRTEIQSIRNSSGGIDVVVAEAERLGSAQHTVKLKLLGIQYSFFHFLYSIDRGG